MSLIELCEQQRQIANTLFKSEGETVCLYLEDNKKSCLQMEEERPLTKQELAWGWARRPFNAYHCPNLCDSCAAYWYAELAAQTLHRMHCLVVRCEAQQKAKGETP